MSPRTRPSVEDVADTLADHILANHAGDLSKEALTELLEEAVEACYGSKEEFFKNFLQYLTKEQIAQLFALISRKMQFASVDRGVLGMIRNLLKKAGAGKASAADLSRAFTPGSAGKMPGSYRGSTTKR